MKHVLIITTGGESHLLPVHDTRISAKSIMDSIVIDWGEERFVLVAHLRTNTQQRLALNYVTKAMVLIAREDIVVIDGVDIYSRATSIALTDAPGA